MQIKLALQSVFFLFLGGLSAPLIADQEPWGERVNGLEISIHLDQTRDEGSDLPNFKVTFHNAGENDFFLNLGFMYANGRKQYPMALFLMITDAAGKTRRFDLNMPGVAGRVDPLVVPLGVGAALSIPVHLHKYWAAQSQEFNYILQAGTYLIEAQFTGTDLSDQKGYTVGIGLMPYWKGTVISNRLQFEVPR